MDICYRCLCNICINNVDNLFPDKQNISCFNCDDCYYYDLKDGKSKNIKFECGNFTIAKYHAERKRIKLKLIKKG